MLEVLKEGTNESTILRQKKGHYLVKTGESSYSSTFTTTFPKIRNAAPFFIIYNFVNLLGSISKRCSKTMLILFANLDP
jgi:hypothetical protein